MGKIFQCLQKKLGRSAIDATYSIEAYKTHVLIWRMFMAASMKAAIHLGPDFLVNLEIDKNTRFENMETVFNITQKMNKSTFRRNSECESPENSSPSWTRSILVNDQAIKWAKAKACVHADSVPCVGRMEQCPGVAHRRWKGQVEDLRMGIDGEAIGFEWIFPYIFDIVYSSRNPERPGEQEHPTRGLRGPDHLRVNVQLHSVENRWWELHLERSESQELREEILNRKEIEVLFTSMEILWIRNSCFKQFIPWIRSVSMRQ